MVVIGLNEVYIDPKKRYYHTENKVVQNISSPYIQENKEDKENKELVNDNIINLLAKRLRN